MEERAAARSLLVPPAQTSRSVSTSVRGCVGHRGERGVDGLKRANLGVRVRGDHLLGGRFATAKLSRDDVIR